MDPREHSERILEHDRTELLRLFQDRDCEECGKRNWQTTRDGSQRRAIRILCKECGTSPVMPPPFGRE